MWFLTRTSYTSPLFVAHTWCHKVARATFLVGRVFIVSKWLNPTFCWASWLEAILWSLSRLWEANVAFYKRKLPRLTRFLITCWLFREPRELVYTVDGSGIIAVSRSVWRLQNVSGRRLWLAANLVFLAFFLQNPLNFLELFWRSLYL